ncbi:MAG TPA: histidine phosphatase family protein [Terriglobales bacterium]|nr:histidine phosphatase family protein [Terriglobales bacterium]
MRLFLVRHAAPEEWSAGRCVGRTDVPLSPAGLRAAEGLAAAFAGLDVAAVYATPLRRAAATAEPIAAAVGRDVTPCPGMREIDFGAFEGRTPDEIERADPDFYARWMTAPAAVRFPGGESYGDVRARAVPAIEEVVRRHADGTAVAVAHAGSIRIVLAWALEMPDAASFRLAVPHAAVSVLDWTGDHPMVRGLDVLGGLSRIS